MLKKTLLAGICLLLSGTSYAQLIELSGTIRDFNASHADMEGVISGVKTGLVESTLGADKNPIYAGPSGGYSLFALEQWYEDVAGVNMSSSLSISLDNTVTADPNVYTFSDSSFFPIDNQLFGNEGRAHNYHFTFELHSSFTYQGGEFFEFTGDDDLWVYIDDQLAVDLGGVHGAASGGVDLDTLGLTIGETYDFDLFFAERHTTQSNFRIDTSIQLDPTPVPEPNSIVLLGLGLLGFNLLSLARREPKYSLRYALARLQSKTQ